MKVQAAWFRVALAVLLICFAILLSIWIVRLANPKSPRRSHSPEAYARSSTCVLLLNVELAAAVYFESSQHLPRNWQELRDALVRHSWEFEDGDLTDGYGREVHVEFDSNGDSLLIWSDGPNGRNETLQGDDIGWRIDTHSGGLKREGEKGLPASLRSETQ